jgi:TRAP-type C4-dicarboxylate transport system permease small subunit
MRFLKRLSTGIARVETFVGAVLALSITLLILLNVVTRSIGASLFWVDEAAITAMVWMAFLGASISLANREAVAVTLLADAIPAGAARWLGRAVDLCVLAFALILLALVWTWYDPLVLAQVGFDLQAFSGATFNFIYQEVSTTLGVPKFWLWLIVPVFAVDISIHAAANLLSPPEVRAASQVPLADPAAALTAAD